MGEFMQPFMRKLQPYKWRYWETAQFWRSRFYCYSFRESIRFTCKSSWVFSDPELYGFLCKYMGQWVFLNWCLWITINTALKEGGEGRGNMRSNWACFQTVAWSNFLTFSLACNLFFAVLLPFLGMAFMMLHAKESTNPYTALQRSLFRWTPSLAVKPDSRNDCSRPG